MTPDEIKQLSDDVFKIAQACACGRTTINEKGYHRLLDAGLALRELAGLPPPWRDLHH
jgi:hypothetical protein